MIDAKKEIWFVTGSQHLYGTDTLNQVASDAQKIAEALDKSDKIPVKIVWKPTLTRPEEVTALAKEANNSADCIGLITWMHTFSPAKMWIHGLSILQKPFMHLHTQFGRDIPWSDIDMDFMNLHQSAHGGREFGFIGARLRIDRTVVVGHWQDPEVIERIDTWSRAAMGWAESQNLKVARFGDNMREVAVTEGDKVEAQRVFGYTVDGYGVGDLVAAIDKVKDSQINDLIEDFKKSYRIVSDLTGDRIEALKVVAKQELGMRHFLDNVGAKAFTTTFENLHGLPQLPGLAVQRLMADGYGFGAEGDWKTSALVRIMKVMANGLTGGTSFMEDYTYHLEPGRERVLGAHMLEICPSISSEQPNMEIHPLGIGGKEDPVRLVFNTATGDGINVSIMDMGNRFRMLVNPCQVVEPDQDLPKLPVARVMWIPEPNLKVAAEAWIHAGGAHHTGFSLALTADHFRDLAQMAGIEMVLIDNETNIPAFKNALRWNEAYYAMAKGFH